ncbi:MAG: hypothetical protein EB114_12395 [Betaproteobacteria bacterium]|nr:hypothetical protein [Betaproteobacteria bacterium]
MATLSSYITEVQRLLHDANSVFWSTSELTDYINDARERVARDTGCLRTLQVTSTPISSTGVAADVWTAGATVATGDFVFSNIFIYEVTSGGVLGTTAPPYPAANYTFPPSTPFTNGTATLQYSGPAEIIPFATLANGSTLDILNVNIYWGNSRIPLRYLPWSNFNAQLRYWQNYVGRPVCFSVYGQNTIYIGPVPDQSYVVEIDTTILPTALSQSTPNAVDPIQDPYTTPVAFYAAYKAKYKEQSYGEAEIYKQEYMKHVQAVLNSVYTRRIPDPYSMI